MTATDLKGAYKNLNKDIADSDKKVVDGRPKVDEMNTAAEGYFAAWKASAEEISDPDLRKRSEERLADAKARFDKIAVAGQDARQSFDTLMTDIKDQSKFLGLDLNASAIATLKPDAAKFNARATTVFTKVDGVSKMYDEYIASMEAVAGAVFRLGGSRPRNLVEGEDCGRRVVDRGDRARAPMALAK